MPTTCWRPGIRTGVRSGIDFGARLQVVRLEGPSGLQQRPGPRRGRVRRALASLLAARSALHERSRFVLGGTALVLRRRGHAVTQIQVKFDAVLFDCDLCVLVDSEPITQVLRDMLKRPVGP